MAKLTPLSIRSRDAPIPFTPSSHQVNRGSRTTIVTQQQIQGFLDDMRERGCMESSIQKYQRDLAAFYQFLPEGKRITTDTMPYWRVHLLEKGYAPRTVNAFLSEANGFLSWLGLRDYQLLGQLDIEDDVQPELTRNEYLRLLSTARTLGIERAYLLVKVFACTGLSLQELPHLTVEAVEENRLSVKSNGVRRIIHIPSSLRRELKGYIHRTGVTSGSVFVTRNGKRLNRTCVTAVIQSLARDARVTPEKCNPRCLRKLYQSTMASIESSIYLLVERSHEQLLDQEQLAIGWEEVEES